MKKITLLLTVCFMLLHANAAIVIDETFNFSVANLAAESSWTTTGTLTTGTGRNIEAGGLVYSNAGGNYIHSGLGKKINQDYSAGTNYIAYKSFPAITTGTVYLSFLYQANGDQGQTASEVLGLSNSATNSAVKIWAGKQTDGTKNPYRVGLTRSSTSSADIVWCPTTLSTSGVYLIVIKYDLATTTASLFINPVVGSPTEPTADVTAATDGTARTSVGYLMFKHNGASVAKFFVGGVRVSTSWIEATASQAVAPKLATPIISNATAVGATGFTANWTSVANAVGYDVKVYLGSNLISTTNVSGQSSQSLAISGLMSGLTYTYRVIAKGDITNFSDSDPSVTSISFSTTNPYASSAINTNFDNGLWGVAVTTQPTSGTYPSSSINGFDLSAAALYERTIKGLKGETHTNRIAIDKLANGGKVTLPTVNSVEQIEIHASAGTEGNGFQLKEFDATTNTWNAIGGTYVYDLSTKNAATDSVYIISVSRPTPTKFRIENPTNGGIYLMQVITRTTNPTLLAKPSIGEASGISSTGFTANWSAVPNATGYKVYVYQAGVQVLNSPFSVSEQSTQSLAITDLTAETAYTYKVQAIGNNDVSYSDSFLSFTTSVTTSTTTGLQSANQKIDLIVTGKTVTAPVNGNFEVFNLQGALVYSAKSTNRINTNLTTGLYILQFTTANGKRVAQKITLK